jgi:hypothetical protein
MMAITDYGWWKTWKKIDKINGVPDQPYVHRLSLHCMIRTQHMFAFITAMAISNLIKNK